MATKLVNKVSLRRQPAPKSKAQPVPPDDGALDADQLERLWVQAGGPPDAAAVMAALALQQSSGHAGAALVNGHESSHGLWQINLEAHPEFAGWDLANPVVSAKAAVQLYKKDGLQPWSLVPANDSDPYGPAKENPVVAAFKAGQDPLSALGSGGGANAPVGGAGGRMAGEGVGGTPPDLGAIDSGGGSGSLPAASTGSALTGGSLGTASLQQLEGANLPTAPLPRSLKPYTGPGGYKGFDLSALSPNLRQDAMDAIDQYLSNPRLQESMLSDIEYNYGAESWAMSDPQIRTVLVVGTILDWGKDPNLFYDQLNRTTWYQTHSDNERAFIQLSADNPGQAKAAVAQAQARVVDMANELGVALTTKQVNTISHTVAANSVDESGAYSATAFSDQELAQAIGAEFNAQTFVNAASGTSPAAAAGTSATGTPVGQSAELFNQFSAIAKEYYLPLNNQQLAAQVQNYIRSYSGQGDFTTGALQGFEAYAKSMAANLYPALANIIGTSDESGGTAQTPYSALAGYRTTIANYTGYNGDPDTIDLSSPQYSWILTGGAPPGQGQLAGTTPGQLPSYDVLQRYLMQQPSYQGTDQAKQLGWNLGNSILKAFGYRS